MPATAGRVRMPANNRVHSSAALQTHGIWQSTIGYDPYAPSKDDSKNASQEMSSTAEPEGENAYANFQGLLALARITSSNADEVRGSCKKCGRVGHLSFQCRNFLSVKEGDKEKDAEAVQAAVFSGLEKIKGNGKQVVESEETEDDDETETSDSEVDSEIERIIAERYGKKSGDKGKSSRKKEDPDVDRSDSDAVNRKKRGRSKKRSSKKRESSASEDEGGRKRRKEKKRRKRVELSDEEEKRQSHKRKSRKEKRRRRSHRYSDYSDSDGSDDSGRWHNRKNRKGSSPSDSDVSGPDDSRIGRRTERSEKKSSKCRH